MTPPSGSSSRSRHTRLIAANCVALAVLMFVTLAVSSRESTAQSVSAARMRGVYTLLSGRVNGMTGNVVWIVDAANRELVALKWDRSHDRFEPLGYRDLAADAANQKRPR